MAYRCSIQNVRCEGQTNCVCFICAQPVCKKCSRVVSRYYKWKLKRICDDCKEERQYDGSIDD